MEILNSYQRKKLDESDDSNFYAIPKFVYHLDSNFRNYLTKLYEKEIKDSSNILDLMSSWDSYIPKGINPKKIVGHGLNKEELTRNKALDEFWTQNFNLNQTLPLADESFDYCLMVAAWQYLQYPEKISQEISRVLNPGGKLLISFSNRAFWSKAPNIWTQSTEEERLNYVRNVIRSNGFESIKIIKSFTSNNYPFFPFFYKDPFYCVIGYKK